MSEKERKNIFSKNLLRILQQKEKSQIEVANAIGVSQQTFNTWCRGVAIPRMGKIQLLADYFHINMADLIEEHDPAAVSADQDPAASFTKEETTVALAYRKSDSLTKAMVRRTLGLDSLEKGETA